MKLSVYSQGARRGVSRYIIAPSDRNRAETPRPEFVVKMLGLAPRIEAMSRKEVGENFICLQHLEGEQLLLSVSAGTAKQKRFELRALLGWIILFDNE